MMCHCECMHYSSTAEAHLRLNPTTTGRAVVPTLSRAADRHKASPAAFRAASATPGWTKRSTVAGTYHCAGLAARGIAAGVSTASVC